MTFCALLGNPPWFRSPRPARPGPGCSCLLFPAGAGGAEGVGKDGVSWAPQVSLLVLGLSCPPWLGWEMASLPHVGLPSVPTALALAGTSDLLGTPAGSLEEGPQQITSVLLPVRPPGLCAGRGTAQSGSPLGLGSGVESCVSLAAHD